jgi:Beta-lactamase
MPRRRRRLLVVLAVLVALAAVGYGELAVSTSRSQLARAIVWGESDVGDYRRFPGRRIAAGPDRFEFRRPAGGGKVPPAQVHRISVRDGDRRVERDLEQFLAGSDTTAFLIVRGDRYVPELAGRDPRFGQITLRHLLTVRSGLRYQEGGTPWSDDTATYYAPDLRALALRKTEIVEAPGRRFHYNNFNPLLIGLALERAVGVPVASYLECSLWQPLGMQSDGSWSLDSRRSGFEKMESGLNGRAIDFAKLGLLYANAGAWQGRQLVPRSWVQNPTVVPTGGGSFPACGYRHWPELLGDMAGRLSSPWWGRDAGPISPAGAMTRSPAAASITPAVHGLR